MYATEEEKRRGFVEMLAVDCPRVFGPDDRGADRAYLETLTLYELCVVYREMIAQRWEIVKANPDPELIAFLKT